MSTVRYATPDEGVTYRGLVDSYGSPLMILDAAVLRARYRALCQHLPGVGLYYAVKALNQNAVLEILADEGAGFDVASAGEIARVQSLGFGPRRTIHTHPIKSDAEIRAALRYGCTTFVVDNGFELQKFVRYRHRVALLLRVGFRNPEARVDLASKFGCERDAVPELLRQAEGLGIHIKGLSFHVGSQCPDASVHVAAIGASLELLEESAAFQAAPMSLLDIGGGFPIAYEHSDEANEALLEGFCEPIMRALASRPEGLEVVAEPGRCISGPAVELVTTVIGKAERNGRTWFYLDEGVYGGFSGQVYDGATYPLVFFGPPCLTGAVLAGPTCDSIDVVREDIETPDLGLGEVIVAGRIGAYSSASATDFNSLRRARWVVVNDDKFEEQVVSVAE